MSLIVETSSRLVTLFGNSEWYRLCPSAGPATIHPAEQIVVEPEETELRRMCRWYRTFATAFVERQNKRILPGLYKKHDLKYALRIAGPRPYSTKENET